jgi:hypothetical protein
MLTRWQSAKKPYVNRRRRHTDAADACHDPSSGIIIEHHLGSSLLVAASDSKVGKPTSSMRMNGYSADGIENQGASVTF